MSRGGIACCVIAFLFAGFFAARNVSSWPTRIVYPGEESYEGAALGEIALLGQGVAIYMPPSAQGFAGGTYGPLYYLLGARLIDANKPSYTPLRVLSAISILGCALGCGLLAFWITRSRLAACLSPLVFLSYGVVTYHGVSALSDNVSLFLFFAGFLIAYRFRNSAALLLAAPVMTLGFYFKPQFIAGPLAVFAFLLLEKQYRRAAEFTGALAVCGFGALAVFQFLVFPGQQFWRHFFLYQATLFSLHQFKVGFLVFALMLAAPLLLAFDFLRRHPDRLLACYLIFAVLLGVVTIGKESAFIQYFYESLLLVSVLVPALLVTGSRNERRRSKWSCFCVLGSWRDSGIRRPRLRRLLSRRTPRCSPIFGKTFLRIRGRWVFVKATCCWLDWTRRSPIFFRLSCCRNGAWFPMARCSREFASAGFP